MSNTTNNQQPANARACEFEQVYTIPQLQAAAPNAILVEGFSQVALRKLNDLIAKGYAINGVAITTPTPDGKTEHGQVTTHGKVLWWHQQPAQQANAFDLIVNAWKAGAQVQYFVLNSYDSEWTTYTGTVSPREQTGRLVWRINEQQAAEPATEADMAVYKAIADNYHASLRQAVEPVADIADLINNLEQLAHRKGELWERCQGKLWPQAESDEFTALRDTLIPRARQELAERVTAPTQQPLTPREVELIDGMIEVQMHHAAQCDAIANRTMADKQKKWDMERVELLRKLKAAHGITSKEGGAA